MDIDEPLNKILDSISRHIEEEMGSGPLEADRIVKFKIEPGDIEKSLETIRPVADAMLKRINIVSKIQKGQK